MANVPDDTKNYFAQTELPPLEEPTINIVPSPTGSQVEDGSLRSPNYRKNSSGWSINSDGTAEFVGLEATNVVITQSFPAAETMSEGTPVGVDWEGKIAKAMLNFPDDAVNQFTNLDTIWKVLPYTQNNFVVVYTTTNGSVFRVRAVVATISSTTNNLTFGTYTEIDALGGESYRNGDACQIDTNTYVVVYSDGAGGEDNYAGAFTISGTTITGGAIKTLSTTDNLNELRCCKSDTLTFFWCGYRDSFGDYDSGTATVSGTTITLEYNSGSAPANILTPATKDIILAQISTDKVAMMQTSTGVIAILTTSGSITAGTGVDLFSTTGTRTTASIISSASDTFFAHLGTGTGYFTVSGTVPSLQGSVVTRTGDEGGMVFHNSVVYDIQTNPTDDRNAGIWSVTQSGSSAVLTQISSLKKTSSVSGEFIASDGYRIFALCPTDLSYWISSMSYNFIGILQDGASTTSGQAGQVAVRGIINNQSGLVAGSYYLVSNGAMSRISPTEVVNTLDDVVNVVKAISASQILI